MLSIIIPVYNAEKVLVRCLSSILSSTFEDFEVLLIDDGSTDSSGYICDKYAKKDSRVRVFHQKNAGVSSARNLGLDNAQGKYISFIDADDYINKNMYQDMVDAMMFQGVDIVICQWDYLYENGRRVNANIQASQLGKMDSNVFFSRIYSNGYNACLISVVWNKLYKAEIFKDVRFKDVKGEDELINTIIFSKNYQVYVMDQSFYCYCQNNYSITKHEKRINYNPDYLDTLVIRSEVFHDNLIFQYQTKEIFCNEVISCWNLIEPNGQKKYIEIIKKFYKDCFAINKSMKYYFKMNSFILFPKLCTLIRKKLKGMN